MSHLAHLFLMVTLLVVSLFPSSAQPLGGTVDAAPYAWEFPEVTGVPLTDPLVSELRREVQHVLDAGPLAPLYISFSDQQSVGYTVYQEPGRIVTTLAWAYPYLDATAQVAVRAYVAAELENPARSPWGGATPSRDGTSNYPLPHNAGAKRESHPRDRWWFEDKGFGKGRPFLHTLYGAWLYTYRVGDWYAVSNHWAAIRKAYSDHGAEDAYQLYGTMGLHVAMARLADHLGDGPTRQVALGRLQAGLNRGLDFAAVETLARGRPGSESRSPYGSYPNMYDRRMEHSTYHGWIFLNLTPELGRFLCGARPELRAAVLARHAEGQGTFPLWWMPKASYFNRSWTGDEGTGLVPEVIGMMAPVERWVVQASPLVLREEMRSAPNGVGDCYWLEALVQAIEAQGTLVWRDVRLPRAAFVDGPGGERVSGDATPPSSR